MKLRIFLFCFTLFFFVYPQNIFAQSCAQNAVCCRASATNSPTCIGGGSCKSDQDCCPTGGDSGTGYNYVCKNDQTPNQNDECNLDCGPNEHCQKVSACVGSCETSATQCNDLVSGSCVPISGGQCGTNCPIGYSILTPCGAGSSAPTPTLAPGATPPPAGGAGCGGPCSTSANCSIAGAINPACVGGTGNNDGICWDGAVCGGGGGGGCGGGCGSCSCGSPNSECREQADCSCKRDKAACCNPDWSDCTIQASGIATQTDLNRCGATQADNVRNCTARFFGRAWIVPAGASCSTLQEIAAKYPNNDALKAATEAASGTRFQFTGDSAAYNASVTQDDGRYKAMDIRAGTSVLDPRPPSGAISVAACWVRKNPSGSTTLSTGQGLGFTVGVPDSGERIYYDLGYLKGTGWMQTYGGDVYAHGAIRQLIPNNAQGPRRFLLDPSTNRSGLLTAGSTYDFDPLDSGSGEGYISDEKWFAVDQAPQVDYFQKFYARFGAPTTESALNKVSLTKPASGTHYLLGPVSTSTTTPWVVAAGEKIVIIVNDSAAGDDAKFTINNPISVTTGGFLAVIVNGDIVVSTAVGGIHNSVTPLVAGVFITSLSGSFVTSPSTPSIPKLVLSGTYVAGNFLLQRDLGTSALNGQYPAEFFYYDPNIHIYMPEEMKDSSVSWEEIAP